MKSSGVAGSPAIISNTNDALLGSAGSGWAMELNDTGKIVWNTKPKSAPMVTPTSWQRNRRQVAFDFSFSRSQWRHEAVCRRC